MGIIRTKKPYMETPDTVKVWMIELAANAIIRIIQAIKKPIKKRKNVPKQKTNTNNSKTQ